MTYLMMQIHAWNNTGAQPQAGDIAKEFNLKASDIDDQFGVIGLGADQYAVMVTPGAAKTMLAKHVDNSLTGKGPFVSGPYSSPGIGPAGS